MRRSCWTPSIVPNDREANVPINHSGRGITNRDPAVAEARQFTDPIPVAHFQTLERRSEVDVSVIQRRSDLVLSVGVAFALALPAILGRAVLSCSGRPLTGELTEQASARDATKFVTGGRNYLAPRRLMILDILTVLFFVLG